MKTRKIKNIYLFLAVLFTCLSPGAFAQKKLYVSSVKNNGDYTIGNPGSVGSLNTKIQEIRESYRGTLVVLFEGGTYVMESPLKITNMEAGGENDSLVLMAKKGNEVIFSGGKRLTNWNSAGNGIFKTRVPSSADFRQLYVNGRMAVRARTPNRTNPNDFGPYLRCLGFDKENRTIRVNSNEVSDWEDVDEVEMVINQHWYQSRIKIESLTIEDNEAIIVPVEPTRKRFFQMTYAGLLNDNKPYYLENSIEFLDQGGEWYLDKSKNLLYYKIREGEDINDLEIVYPEIEHVIQVHGTPESPVYNLTLKNLHIQYSNWAAPSENGLVATQAVQSNLYPDVLGRGIVHVEYARNFTLRNCKVTGTGNHGIVFSKGVQNSQIRNCHLDQISGNGIVIDTYKKAFPPDSLSCENNRISDNLIENIGMHYTNGMGLLASCVSGLVVENNEIRYGRYSGMQIGNHYGDNLSGMRDNLIRRNNIHHVMQLHDDGGAIYTLALQPGTKILSNWMHDFGKSEWADSFPVNGIFLDNNSGYIWVQDNVFTNVPTIDRIKEQGAGNATTRDNILVNNNTQSVEIKEESGIRSEVGPLK